ncbi:hypothetical protein YW3DRAFT_00790 [Streptomyces sp. MnatMP-M77]|uniref:hypothetical protein n=1 Tax=Streptomyces TaxID=1883 RepID=UPI00080516A2|nr:hypothetical protein [Streptomyces sp. MnatMP-M77]MYT77757.1 hypothetical protein [Streptomyces sp. SID8364]SBU90740.1 hypothetical protein YW3DRAFT_00790 [Streptomyces sp. MnatMP-M77]
MGGTTAYVRFQGTERSPRGHFPGIFALAGGLAREGRLTEEQHRFWRAANDWYDAAYSDPSRIDPAVYDAGVNPGAVAWFKGTATHLLDRIPGYLALLAAHGVACERVESADPGRVVYEDEHQVVVVPHSAGERPTDFSNCRAEYGI